MQSCVFPAATQIWLEVDSYFKKYFKLQTTWKTMISTGTCLLRRRYSQQVPQPTSHHLLWQLKLCHSPQQRWQRYFMNTMSRRCDMYKSI